MFHRNPEKWVTGAYIKIGYFGEESDLRYQDEIRGFLFIQADRVIELIYLKYMKAMISYDNVTRIETYPFPKAAVREAVYNAIIHRLWKAFHKRCYAKLIVMQRKFLFYRKQGLFSFFNLA